MRWGLQWVFVGMLGAALGVGCSDGGAGGSAGSGGAGGDGGSGGASGDVFPCTEQGIRDAVNQGGGPHLFDCEGPTTVETLAFIEIDQDVILDGRGDLTIDGDEHHHVFSVAYEVTVTLRGLTVTGGNGTRSDSGGVSICNGGGIRNTGTLTLERVVVTDNDAGTCDSGGAHGGGISATGPVTLIDSTVSNNRASSNGGGISSDGPLTLIRSTVSGNESNGISNGFGLLTLTNSSISGNSPTGIMLFDELVMTNTTIADNDVAIDTRGDSAGRVTTDATQSIIEGPCYFTKWTWTSHGHNVESPGDTCGFTHETDEVSVSMEELGLGELGDHGGVTQTQVPQTGSVAIDLGPDADCASDADQRGAERPQGAACDAGAVEVAP